MHVLAWAWYSVCALCAFALFWLPPWAWTLGHWREPFPLGLGLALALCIARDWTAEATVPSIKPLPSRPRIDAWQTPGLDWLIGNPDDGVSGRFAFGPDWTGAYNPTGSTWRAVCWQCRNWFAGLGYRTWFWPGEAPIIKRPYRILGRSRLLQLGWTELPTADGWSGLFRYRMVCSA